MTKLILGGGRFAAMDYLPMESLISTARNEGITTIDTAASYGDEELGLGKYLRKNKNADLKIMTKLGIPAIYNRNQIRLSPLLITSSVDLSLKRLGVETIDTLFLHSVDSVDFTDDNFGALLKLKNSGKIKGIGYTGDGHHMELALKSNVFDTLMMTLNCLDQRNKPLANSVTLGQRLFIKRALGNAVWLHRNHTKLNHFRDIMAQFGWLDESLRKVIGAKSPRGFTSYQFRYNAMFDHQTRLDMTEIFLNFALSTHNVHSVLIGTSSTINLLRLVQISKQVTRLTDIEIMNIESLFEHHANKSWGALT